VDSLEREATGHVAKNAEMPIVNRVKRAPENRDEMPAGIRFLHVSQDTGLSPRPSQHPHRGILTEPIDFSPTDPAHLPFSLTPAKSIGMGLVFVTVTVTSMDAGVESPGMDLRRVTGTNIKLIPQGLG
jgi:hypothetical protein